MLPLLLLAGNVPGVGGVVASAEASVKNAVSSTINSVVGQFDPGKARDRDREMRAEMWYQLAKKGSVYAAQHVLGGRTLVYTVKEKKYYETRWAQLRNDLPQIAQQAETLGGLGIPDNPTDAEQRQIAQEIVAFNQSNVYSAPYGTGIEQSSISFTPRAQAPAQVPYVPSSSGLYSVGGGQHLPAMFTTAERTPEYAQVRGRSNTMLYVAVAVGALALLYVATRGK